jgi:hypothetical protein
MRCMSTAAAFRFLVFGRPVVLYWLLTVVPCLRVSVCLRVYLQHLPWHMPREFWDMYPPTEEIDLPKHQESPTDMPPIAFTYV